MQPSAPENGIQMVNYSNNGNVRVCVRGGVYMEGEYSESITLLLCYSLVSGALTHTIEYQG